MIIIKKKFVKHLQKACGTPVKSQCLRLFRRNRTEGNRRTTKGSSFLQIREEEEADVTGKSEASVIGREGRGPRIGRRLIGRSVLEGSRDSGIRLHTFLPGGLAAASAVVVWTPARGRRHGFVLFGGGLRGFVLCLRHYRDDRESNAKSLVDIVPTRTRRWPPGETWKMIIRRATALRRGSMLNIFRIFESGTRSVTVFYFLFSLSLSLYLS